MEVTYLLQTEKRQRASYNQPITAQPTLTAIPPTPELERNLESLPFHPDAATMNALSTKKMASTQDPLFDEFSLMLDPSTTPKRVPEINPKIFQEDRMPMKETIPPSMEMPVTHHHHHHAHDGRNLVEIHFREVIAGHHETALSGYSTLTFAHPPDYMDLAAHFAKEAKHILHILNEKTGREVSSDDSVPLEHDTCITITFGAPLPTDGLLSSIRIKIDPELRGGSSGTFFAIVFVDEAAEMNGIVKPIQNRVFFPKRITLLIGKGDHTSPMTTIEEGENHLIKVEENIPCKRCKYLKTENANAKKKGKTFVHGSMILRRPRNSCPECNKSTSVKKHCTDHFPSKISFGDDLTCRINCLDDHHKEGKSDVTFFRLEMQGYWSSEGEHSSFPEQSLTTVQSNTFHLMSHRKPVASASPHYKAEADDLHTPPLTIPSSPLLEDKQLGIHALYDICFRTLKLTTPGYSDLNQTRDILSEYGGTILQG
eukprot:TRINITY_DN1339_c0_g1_i2.p1 TRINITY_DN1339_c0_g1~~TRINITY_DN1339_c0_g1_i2.p1  ORF type:complete len:484 (+),score=94.26 TRINITY_DN1339_c0_g1_i2:165-1616(+)